ncbi:hypothetical protein AXW37_16170 [Yersinia ruckeri]|uniref:hypothetical protein n=1 Tax=Yersinia ruckeri TaxID=29486 RepID=UPI0008FCFCA1|nr:hypothetical protein [Yersinia ruckeri]EKN4695863.1 fimbrial protein [Yersinia ruckeri]MCW6524107.1 fimbrial protein [Yersinia ruckeri]MCW6527802.1 fimbrial protein [Yersinia ruckeri]MCW6562841.1 fimbrial protein [Yersinia ruckeri]MCW6604646.1 fimbrial protein [Yersinia ruckeri]
MNIHHMIAALILPLLSLPVIASESIEIGTIDVSVQVTEKSKIIVEKTGGGSLTSLTLKHDLHQQDIYRAQAPVTVKVKRAKGFRVRLAQPLILRHQSDGNRPGSRQFSAATVRLHKVGENRANTAKLSHNPLVFNHKHSGSGWYSQDYELDISAKAPTGNNTIGLYHGVLTLLFEAEA